VSLPASFLSCLPRELGHELATFVRKNSLHFLGRLHLSVRLGSSGRTAWSQPARVCMCCVQGAPDKPKREKKEFDMPGQTKDPPPEVHVPRVLPSRFHSCHPLHARKGMGIRFMLGKRVSKHRAFARTPFINSVIPSG